MVCFAPNSRSHSLQSCHLSLLLLIAFVIPVAPHVDVIGNHPWIPMEVLSTDALARSKFGNIRMPQMVK